MEKCKEKPALKESIPFFIIAVLLALLVACWFGLWIAWIPALLAAYILYFFRDPERSSEHLPASAVVSAADGKVISVEEVDEPIFQSGKMIRVAVFLSVFNVHVNRSPFGGEILETKYKKGEFLDARNPEIDIRNEAMSWLIKTERGSVVVRQIAGLIARRIVAWKMTGDKMDRGERFGMIRFGSRTDIYLPLGTRINVKAGDVVQGGLTVVAEFATETSNTSES